METVLPDVKHCACFTGHRPSKFPFDTQNRAYLDIFLSTVYLLAYDAITLKQINTFYCGMQVGMDIWAGKQILMLKSFFPDTKLVCVSPFEREVESRHGNDLDDYLFLKKNCDEFIALEKNYSSGCYTRRNSFMVERSGYVIAALSDERSGTSQTIRYARRLGRDIHIIDLKQFAVDHLFKTI